MLLQFGDLVGRRLGLRFQIEQQETLRSALMLQAKRRGFKEPSAYLEFLVSDAGESAQGWKDLIPMLTNGETYFFRDRGVFSLLRNTILPELIERNRARRSLRIWCAGCSTGEEPFSIALLLALLLPDSKSWDIAILGTDINEAALAKAAQGIYSTWSFRLMDDDLRDSYFKYEADGWKIADSLKKMVSFQYGNILEAGRVSLGGRVGDFDLLVCRNVLIYFEKGAVAQVAGVFRDLLAACGTLFVGHAELYGHELAGFRRIMYPEAMVYRKGLPATSPPRPLVPAKPPMKPKERKAPLPPVGAMARAHAHANAGNYAEAQLLCREVISLDADTADPFFLLAHIAEALGKGEEAKQLLKKAIYLQPLFVAAYCELGSLYDRENDDVHARKARLSALGFLKDLPSTAKVPPYEITAGELHQHLEKLTAPGSSP